MLENSTNFKESFDDWRLKMTMDKNVMNEFIDAVNLRTNESVPVQFFQEVYNANQTGNIITFDLGNDTGHGKPIRLNNKIVGWVLSSLNNKYCYSLLDYKSELRFDTEKETVEKVNEVITNILALIQVKGPRRQAAIL